MSGWAVWHWRTRTLVMYIFSVTSKSDMSSFNSSITRRRGATFLLLFPGLPDVHLWWFTDCRNSSYVFMCCISINSCCCCSSSSSRVWTWCLTLDISATRCLIKPCVMQNFNTMTATPWYYISLPYIINSSDGQKLTKKLPTKSLTEIFS